MKEFELQKDLKHPNIVEVVELISDDDRNTLYTVMELVEGLQL
jgi:serine/threonine protein kinase